MIRELMSHKSGAADTLQVVVVDAPGLDGANHVYAVRQGATSLVTLTFQNGPLNEAGANGLTNAVLLAVLIDRMEGFQSGPFATDEIEVALKSCREALRVVNQGC